MTTPSPAASHTPAARPRPALRRARPAVRPASPLADDAPLAERAADLLLRLERGVAGLIRMVGMAHMDGAGGDPDVRIYAAVAIDAGDGAGRTPYPLEVVDLAATALAADPPRHAPPGLAARLRGAAADARRAAERLLADL